MDYAWVYDGFVWLTKLAGVVHLMYLINCEQPKGRAKKMPKATVDISKTERKELKTLPGDGKEEAGYVVLRTMSYGEFLHRRDLISKMSFEGKGDAQKATIESANATVAQYEFNACIVDHNLEDDNGKPIDFRSTRAFNILNPRVGEEISSYIDKMNKWDEEGEEELGNSVTTSTE